MKQINPETLQDLVDRIMKEQNLSTYDVARRSKGLISQSVVSKIKNGNVTNPTGERLRGLAAGLGVPLQLVTDAVLQEQPNLERINNERFQSMSLRFDGMSDEQKALADPIIQMMERELERIAKR